MRTKAICPKNKKHNKFVTTAHEVHNWIVDGHGDFVGDLGCLEVTVQPDTSNIWTCRTCGTEAKFVEVED